MLPSSAIGAIVNMALMVMGKVPVNLNYTLSPEVMEKALVKANINKVITAEKFLNKLNAKGFAFDEVLAGKTIFAEELGKKSRKVRKCGHF
ncbi:2-acyl-glycerophospho-ethanolamine acyltransferase [Rodentibacter pneumotropicus]|uniref:2-acyl-glycerophospho-ethanolamine acyltransferase n=1 Tax=Rodentibacter pneumotropicus TaxID=758 RepID=A0A3S4TT62_9PAST|nr:2-acyl-glycerophospho-ethanolamine acyltransferase [Rodentibacter pneumotropicus]